MFEQRRTCSDVNLACVVSLRRRKLTRNELNYMCISRSTRNILIMVASMDTLYKLHFTATRLSNTFRAGKWSSHWKSALFYV